VALGDADHGRVDLTTSISASGQELLEHGGNDPAAMADHQDAAGLRCT
jgi:hypothetical protein